MTIGGPSFLNNVGDTPEEKDLLEPLQDQKVEGEPEKPVDTTGEDTPPENKVEDKKPEDEKPEDKKEEVSPENKEGEQPPENKQPENKEPEKPVVEEKPITYNGQTFKNMDDFTKYVDTLKTSIDKNTQPNTEDEKFKKTITALKSIPLIKATLPTSENYHLEDGKFDIDSYLEDAFNAFAVAIQQNMVGGPMAGVMFGLLKNAFVQETGKVRERDTEEQKIAEIQNNIIRDFPILKDNEKLGIKVSRALNGYKIQRMNEAQAAKKDYVPPTYEELKEIIYEELADVKVESKPNEDPIEKAKAGTVLKDGVVTKKTELEQDIDDMYQHKQSSGGILF